MRRIAQEGMIRSLLSYAKNFTAALLDPAARALVLAHKKGPSGAVPDHRAALRSAVGYLLRAQQRGADAGMGSYHLTTGWGASYPETTGYAIPTLLAAADLLGQPELRAAAIRSADWLLSIQRADGGWQGGRVGEVRPSIVFNTAQVVRGLLAAHAVTEQPKYLEAALHAGRWMVSAQDDDGAWRASNFMGAARVYDTYVDAPLLRLHTLAGDERFLQAATKNLSWVLAQQQQRGWFANADNTERHNDRPITHTIAYTLDGLLECARITGDMQYATAAIRAAHPLAERYRDQGRIHGRYDARWQGSEHPLMTGCAQLAIVWMRLADLTNEALYRDVAQRMVHYLKSVQHLGTPGPAEAEGALPGSFPLWGRYEKFAFPNWGTKYFADALLCAEGHPPAF